MYYKFETPLRVEVVRGKVEPEDYNAVFVEIRGVTINSKEINPEKVIRIFGTRDFDWHAIGVIHDDIVSDFYQQIREIETVDQGQVLQFVDLPCSLMCQRHRRVLAGKDGDRDDDTYGVVFDMVRVERPHYSIFFAAPDFFSTIG